MPTEWRAHNGHNGSGQDAAAALADLGAERALLGAVLAEPRRLSDIEATLRYDDFADSLHEEVYGLICRMWARGADIDVVTVAAEAGRERLAGYEGAHQLRAMVTDLPDAAHIASYLAIVRDLGRRRRLVGAGLDVRRAALDSATPTGEAQERARTLLAAAVADTGDGDMVSLGDAVDEWLRDMATPLAERPMGLSTGLRDLDTLLLGGVRPSDLVILAGRPAMGKCLGPGTPVLMFDGTVRAVETVRPGEKVMGPDNTPRTVLSTSTGEDEMYRIVPRKGDPWVCNSVHILSLVSHRGKNRGEIIDIPLNEYVDPRIKHDHTKLKMFRVGVDFPERQTLLPPYLAGLWLGDGTRAKAQITNKEPVIAAYCQEIAPSLGCDCTLTPVPQKNTTTIGFRWSDNRRWSRLGPSLATRGIRRLLNEAMEKRIAPEYLYTSRQARLDLLAGLVDTDGYVCGGCIDFTTKDTALKDDMLYLCRSLGFAAYARPKIARIKALGFEGTYWRIFISGDLSVIPCRVLKMPVRRKNRSVLRTGFTVEPIGCGTYHGFTLDGDGRFLLGDFTVTHNSSWMIGMARTAALGGASVVLFSLEMPRKQLVMRMLSIETGVPLPDVWRADPSSPYHRALCAGAERLKGYIGRCAIYDRPRATVGEMARLAARVQERDGLGLVMVDYLQRVTGGGQESRVQEVAAIAADLKTMARELDVPVVALSQVNRAVEARAEHRPGMADLSESGNVERESDVVIFLYREHYYTKQPDVETRAEAIVAKQRNGPTGTVQLEWTPALTRFSSAPQAGSPPSASASPAVAGAPSVPDFAVAADAHTYDF